MARGPGVAFLGILLGLSSASGTTYTPQQINAECQMCDAQIAAAINTYQSNFGTYARAIDGAKRHCGIFASLKSCYTNCLHGTTYTYASSMQSQFAQFYQNNCDPVCYVAVLPYCYAKTVGVYDTTKSCNGNSMDSNLKACVYTELFINQNCTGSCTPGQRKANFFFFNTVFQCTIPYTIAADNNCFSWGLYCSESTFGYDGATFVSFSNQTLRDSNELACRSYAYQYASCISAALDDNVTIGQEPYSVTYYSPCSHRSGEIKWLIAYTRQYLLQPFCDATSSSYYDICRAYLPTTLPPTTTTVATTTRAASTLAAITAGGPVAAQPLPSTNAVVQSSTTAPNGGNSNANVPAPAPQGPPVTSQPPPTAGQPAGPPVSGSGSVPAPGPGLVPDSGSGSAPAASPSGGTSQGVGDSAASPNPPTTPQVTTTRKPTASTRRQRVTLPASSATTLGPCSMACWIYLVTLLICIGAPWAV